MDDPRLSVVVPVTGPRAHVERFVAQVQSVLEQVDGTHELVLVHGGADDPALSAAVGRLAEMNPTVVRVRLSRAFGTEAAGHAGLGAARGRAAVLLPGDDLDAIEALPELVARWEGGAQVVHGVREPSAGPLRRAWTAPLAALMARTTGRDHRRMSRVALLDRGALDAVLSLRERVRSWTGLTAWVGFVTDEVVLPSSSTARPASPVAAVEELLAFTSLPLHLVATVSFGASVIAGGLGLIALWDWLVGAALGGFPTTIGAIVIVGGANLLSIAVLSLYVAAIYEEVKARPVYLLRQAPGRSEAG